MLTLLTSAAVLLNMLLILCCTVLMMEIKSRIDNKKTSKMLDEIKGIPKFVDNEYFREEVKDILKGGRAKWRQ